MPIDFTSTNPATLEEAVAVIAAGLTDQERKVIRAFEPARFHHTVGQDMRNGWRLWLPEAPLMQHFAERFGLLHPDDVSGLVLEALWAEVNGDPHDPSGHVAACKAHWAIYDPSQIK